MARGQRNNNKMTRRKLQPAVMQVELQVPAGTSYVDLNLCASLLNRRAYKQENTNWMVSGFEFLAPESVSPGTVVIGKLQETWVTENAYKKTRALWNEMNAQVLDTEPGIEGKYSDFKIYLNDAMRQESIQDSNNVAGRILTPFIGGWTSGDFTAIGPSTADWNWSQLTIPNDPASGTTSEYFIHAIGPDTAASKGMIAGYELSRSRPVAVEPNVPGNQGWMTELFDVGEQLDELRDNLEFENDRALYPVGPNPSDGPFYPGGANEYVGLQVHGFCNFTSTTVSSKNSIQGGMFGLGMMTILNNTETTLSLLVHLVPGTHRGYMVEELC